MRKNKRKIRPNDPQDSVKYFINDDFRLIMILLFEILQIFQLMKEEKLSKTLLKV
jgi:hypothetical protein